jgi:hypothetical protein
MGPRLGEYSVVNNWCKGCSRRTEAGRTALHINLIAKFYPQVLGLGSLQRILLSQSGLTTSVVW